MKTKSVIAIPIQPQHVDGSPNRLLAPGEVATLFGVTEGCLARWRSQGKSPAYHRIHGRIRYAESDVQAFLDGVRR
jgi:hypothetical protein